MAGVWTGAQDVLVLGVGAGARAVGKQQRRWGTQAAEACRSWGAQASGTAWAREALAGARSSGGRAAGQAGSRAWAAATRGELGGRAAGAGRGARGGWLSGLCASGVRSWARLGVLVHLTQFLAWFDSVFS